MEAASNDIDNIVRDWDTRDELEFKDAPTVDDVLERLSSNNWQQIAVITTGVCMVVMAITGGILYRIPVRCRRRKETVGPHHTTTKLPPSHVQSTSHSDGNEFPSMVDTLRMC